MSSLAMRPGYSTATEEIRELGFGAGMGLVNIKRCVDSMKLESTWGKGTRLRMKIFLQKPEGHTPDKESVSSMNANHPTLDRDHRKPST